MVRLTSNVLNIKTNKMEIQSIDSKIQLKIKQIQLEKDNEKKRKYQNDLEVLKLKKDIELLKNRIKQKLSQR